MSISTDTIFSKTEKGNNNPCSEEATPTVSARITQTKEKHIIMSSLSRRPIPSPAEQPTRFIARANGYGQHGIGGWAQPAGPINNQPIMPGGLPTISWVCSCQDCLVSVKKFLAVLNNSNGMYGACVTSSGPIYSEILPSGIYVPSFTTGKLVPATSREIFVATEGNANTKTFKPVNATTDATSASSSTATTTTDTSAEKEMASTVVPETVISAKPRKNYVAGVMPYYGTPMSMAPNGYLGQGLYSGGTVYYNNSYWVPPINSVGNQNLSTCYTYGAANGYPYIGSYQNAGNEVGPFETSGEGSDVFKTLVATPQKVETTDKVYKGPEIREGNTKKFITADGNAAELNNVADCAEKVYIPEGNAERVNIAGSSAGKVDHVEGNSEGVNSTEKVDTEGVCTAAEEFKTAEGSTEEIEIISNDVAEIYVSLDNSSEKVEASGDTEGVKRSESSLEKIEGKAEKVDTGEDGNGKTETGQISSENVDASKCNAQNEEIAEGTAEKQEVSKDIALKQQASEGGGKKHEDPEVSVGNQEVSDGASRKEEVSGGSAQKEGCSAEIFETYDVRNKKIYYFEDNAQEDSVTDRFKAARKFENIFDEFNIISNGIVEIKITENGLNENRVLQKELNTVKIAENGLVDIQIVQNGVGLFDNGDDHVFGNDTEIQASGVYENEVKNYKDTVGKGYKAVRIVDSVKKRIDASVKKEEGITRAGGRNVCALE